MKLSSTLDRVLDFSISIQRAFDLCKNVQKKDTPFILRSHIYHLEIENYLLL